MTDGVYEENDDTTQGSQRPRHRRSWPSIAGTAEQRASRGLSILEDITRLISEWVWETDTQSFLLSSGPEAFSSMAFTRLVLPAPEGAEIKKRIPLVIVTSYLFL